MERVSVVIAAHNEELNLRACLDSLFQCVYPSFEVIVVNDGSTDATADILASYESFPLRVIHQAHQSGPAYCRNRGWELSGADLIFFTDADCQVNSNWISAGVQCLIAKGVVGVEGNTACTGFSEAFRFRAPLNPFYEAPTPWANRPQRDFATSNIAFRRDALVRLGGFREERFSQGREDTDLGWRARALGTIAHCAEMTVFHRAEWWTPLALLRNSRRYQCDVAFFKEHQFFFYRRGRILHPRLLALLLFPPVIFWYYRLTSWRDLRFLPSFYGYLLAVRLYIWKGAIQERVLVF